MPSDNRKGLRAKRALCGPGRLGPTPNGKPKSQRLVTCSKPSAAMASVRAPRPVGIRQTKTVLGRVFELFTIASATRHPAGSAVQ